MEIHRYPDNRYLLDRYLANTDMLQMHAVNYNTYYTCDQ